MRRSRESLRAQRPQKGVVTRARRRAYRFLWDVEEESLTPGWRAVVSVVRVVVLTLAGFFRERLQTLASSLAFYSLLAMVPLAALTFTLAKGFGFYAYLLDENIKPYIADIFQDGVGGEDIPEGLTVLRATVETLLDVIGQTDVSSLGIAGLVFLLLYIGRVLQATEEAFDTIWEFPSHRPLPLAAPRFLFVLLVTAPILVFSTFLTAAKTQHAFMENVRLVTGLPALIDGLAFFLPPLLVVLALLPAYLLMPSAPVRFRSALLGAVVGGIGWYILQVIHVRFQVGVARYNALYSGLGAFPIFLVWLQFSWAFILLGAQAAASHQNAPTLKQLARRKLKDHASRQAVALRAMVELAVHPEGQRLRDLAEDLAVGVEPLRECLNALADHGLVESDGPKFNPRFRVTEDPAELRVTTVLDALENTTESTEIDVLPVEATDAQLREVLLGLQSAADASSHNRTIDELRRATVAPPQPQPPPDP